MPKNNSVSKKLVILCIALIGIMAVAGLVSAPASSQESRVNALEVDLRGVQLRLNRIEAQLNQSSRSGSVRVPTAAPPSSTGRIRQRLSSDPMFDRLATLAIELRERIDRLDARVSKLESRGAPRTKS